MKKKQTARKQAPKRKGQARGKAAPQPEYEIAGFRLHDMSEHHFPFATLTFNSVEKMVAWLIEEAWAEGSEHVNCGFAPEMLLLHHNGHEYTRNGSFQDPEHPTVDTVEWSKSDPMDLGHLLRYVAPEELPALQTVSGTPVTDIIDLTPPTPPPPAPKKAAADPKKQAFTPVPKPPSKKKGKKEAAGTAEGKERPYAKHKHKGKKK